jgi:hypothetical protein
MKGRKSRGRLGRFEMLGKTSVLGPESLVLVLLSAGDLLVTYSLLWQGRFYEANPVARWVFNHWNIAGMTAFKFGVIAGVIVLGETIERHRPGVGRAILILGSVAAAAVMVHGLRLMGSD